MKSVMNGYQRFMKYIKIHIKALERMEVFTNKIPL